MDRWIDGCKSALKTLRGALNRGAFSLTLAACLAMVGGAAYYARNAGRTPTPAAPQPTIAPVVMTPSSVETLEDALARDTAPQPIWPLSGREQLTMHDEHAPQWSETLGIWTIHTGVDIAAAAGEAVLATLAGTVVRAERDAQLGNLIEIQHDDGHLSRYANLSTMLVTVGERVLQAQAIGAVGTSADAEAALPPHLHYELYKSGKWALPQAQQDDEETTHE